MKKVLSICFAAILLTGLNVSTTLAQSYISGNFSFVSLSDSDFYDGVDTGSISFDTGFGFGAALGNKVNNSRFEVELSYKSNDMDSVTVTGFGSGSISGDIDALTIMGNAFLDFDTNGNFSPFIGGGLGLAKLDASITGFGSEDDTVLAYQFSVGGSFASSETVSLDFQYRFLATEDPNFEGLETEYTSHNFMIGFRHTF